ncbi:MAG: hypothetical protein IT449_08370 [Phycisphaerales bacterium]|nr:hypothetical protein [Phycisphaerales bacterium]
MNRRTWPKIHFHDSRAEGGGGAVVPRRGSRRTTRGVMLYGATLMLSMLVAGMCITLVSLQMASRRMQTNLRDRRNGQELSHSGMEFALATVQADAAWRGTFTTNPTVSIKPDGLGRIDVTVADDDGNLQDDDTEAASVTVFTRVNGLEQTFAYAAKPHPSPTMAYGIAARGTITFTNSAKVDAPLYAKTSIIGAGATVTTGSAASFNVPTGGVITATLTPQNLNEESYTMPAPDLNFYINLGTALPPTAKGSNWSIEGEKITAAYNSIGAVNKYGIYVIDIGSKNLDIRDSLIEGTLVVLGSNGNKVKVDKPVIIRPGANPYPSLIISLGAGSSVDLMIPNSLLDESSAAEDFNGDGDKADTLTPSVSGLVYVSNADTTLGSSVWTFTGCLQAGNVTVSDGVILGDGTTNLAGQLSPGFTDNVLHPISGSGVEVLP